MMVGYFRQFVAPFRALREKMDEKRMLSDAHEAVLMDTAAGVEWMRSRLMAHEKSLRAVEDDIEELRAKLQALESTPIHLANLQNWIDVVKDGHIKLTEVVYEMKGRGDAPGGEPDAGTS